MTAGANFAWNKETPYGSLVWMLLLIEEGQTADKP